MGQFALVTGASRGLGRAIATHLSRKGYTLILNSRDLEALKKVQSELQGANHLVIDADMATSDGLRRLSSFVSDSVGSEGLKVWVHCAAHTPNPEV